MATRLASRGYRVLYIESLGLRKPTRHSKDIIRIFKRLRKGFQGLQQVQNNIWLYSPLVIPFHEHQRIRLLNRKILIKQVLRYIQRLEFHHPIFWTYNPLTVDLIGIFQESLVIYHCVDDLTASPGMPVNAIESSERELVQRSDLIFTTNIKLQQTRSQWNPDNTYYFPNVADFEHFSKALQPGKVPDDLARIPHPRIGFIGAISDYKVDFDLISYIATLKKEWQWIMIGQIGEGQPETKIDLLKKSNIHFLGPKSYHSLPDYLRGIDIAVLPNRINDYTSSMFPMKFFEYLSAGKPIVATNLPAIRDYSDVCFIAQNADDFIKCIDRILHGEKPDIMQCLKVAQEHTWEKRLDQMEFLIMKKWNQKYGN